MMQVGVVAILLMAMASLTSANLQIIEVSERHASNT
jgi:hypothetical protein